MYGSIERLRHHTSRHLAPRSWLHLAWGEYLHQNPDRARAALRRAARTAREPADRADVQLTACLIEELLQAAGDGGRGASTPSGGRAAPGRSLLALAHHAVGPDSERCPLAVRREFLRELQARAEVAGSSLAPALALAESFAAMQAGGLAEATRLARAVARRSDAPPGMVGRARFLAQVLAHRAGGGGLLQGLSLAGQNPQELLSSRLALGAALLRSGFRERARALLHQASRPGGEPVPRGAGVELQLLRLELAVLSRDPVEVTRELAQVREFAGRDTPGAWRADLLEARHRLDCGDAISARATLSRVRPRLEALGAARPIQEARLLQLRLDLPTGLARGGELVRRWEEVAGWEEVVDRWRWVALALPALPEGELRRGLLAALERDAASPDPRARILRELVLGRLELAQGDRPAAAARLRGLPFPPPADLPELTLRRWTLELLAGLPEPSAASPAVTAAPPAAPPPVASPRLDLTLDLERRTVTFRGRALDFRRRERMLHLLEAMLVRPGATVTRGELLEAVWGRPHVPYQNDGLVHTAISRLRRLLGCREVIVEEGGAYGLAPSGRHRLVGPDSASAARVPKVET